MNEKEKSTASFLLGEYFSGTLDTDTHRRVQEWLFMREITPEKEAALKDIFDHYMSEDHIPSGSALKAWQQRSRELGFTEKKTLKLSSKRISLRVAAIVFPLLILAGAGLLLINRFFDPGTENVAVIASTVISTEEVKEIIILPCGTRIWLNTGTELKYNEDDPRKVELTGEAYFSVTRVDGLDFRVVAGDMTVRVLGTEFNINTRAEGGHTEVSLFNGKVEVQTASGSFLLAPEQQFVFDIESGTGAVVAFEPLVVERWKTTLSLENVTLSDAFRLIGNHYGLTVIYDERGYLNKLVRATFVNEEVDEVLGIIREITGGFDYTIQNDSILINRRP